MEMGLSRASGSAAPCCWSHGEQRRVLRLLIVWVCWVFFQVEGGSPGTTAILFTLAVYLVEGPRNRRRPGRSSRRRLWPDSLSSAENGSSSASLELTANLLRTGTLSSHFDAHARHVQQFLSPVAATLGAAGGSTAAAAAAAAASTARTPKTPATSAGQNSFEAAMTRLAGAAELGTEALIYVRRADVAEIVDVLMDHARSRAGPTVTSPALARLALVRRSRRRDLPNGSGRRACSPVPRGTRPLSGLRRLGSPAVDGARDRGGVGSGAGHRLAASSPSSLPASAAAASVFGGRALFHDSVMTPPLRDVTRTNSSSTRVTFRARSPAESPSGENAGNGGGSGSAGARRVRGSQDGKQRRLRQRVRSPSPPSSALVPTCPSACVVGTTPIALTKNSEAPLGPNAGDEPSTARKKIAAPCVPLATKAGENVAACTTPATEGKISIDSTYGARSAVWGVD
eukprot:g11102.t1